MKGQYSKSKEQIEKIREANKHAKKGSKPVKELNSGLIFGSAHLASVYFKTNVYRVKMSLINSCSILKDGTELIFVFI